MEGNDFDKFRTSLKEVLSFIKYLQDADRLGEVVEADEGFRHLGRAEVDVLNVCAGANLEMEKGEEVINVCLALEEMKRRAVEKGVEEERIAAEEKRIVLDVSERDRETQNCAFRCSLTYAASICSWTGIPSVKCND